MAVNKVVYGNDTIIDLTGDTATAEDVVSGKSFHLASGVRTTGTATYANSPVANGNATKTNGILYGAVDATSTSTAFTATIDGLDSYYDGATVLLKNGVVASASDFTININGLGAKPVYHSMGAATRVTTEFKVAYTWLLIYDSTRVDGGCWLAYYGYYSDSNSVGYQIRTQSALRPASDKGYRYRLWFSSLDGSTWIPANTSTSTNATAARTPNTRTIDPFGEIVYNSTNGTTDAGENLPVSTCWSQYILVLGYSFNTTGAALTLTNPAPVYLKCTPQSGGGVKMDEIVQTLPSTEDGKVYIFLGMAYDATHIELLNNHPVYYYSNGAIRLWTNADSSGSGSVSPATVTPKMDGTGAVGTSVKYAREDHVHPSDTTKYSINNYGQGTTDVSIRPLVAGTRANRLAFLPANQIIVEKTTDGGTTWEDAGIADNTKLATFATRSGNILIPLLNGAKSTLCGVRITITAMKYNVPEGTAETAKYNYWNSTYVNSQERYTNLREMWFWVSANNDALRVQVSAATGANPNDWKSVFNTDFALKGWSGSDWVRLDGKTFGGGTTQTGNYWNWRITFWSRMNDGASAFASTSQQSVLGIQGYGDSWWGASNSLMREDHLYSWDVNQNATFPANVTATKFNGALSGNATSATKATQDESGNNIKASYAAAMSLNGSSLSLNNKNGTALSTVSLPSSTSVTITIAVSDWSSKTCTKSVTGVTASNNIVVAPSPTSFLAYGEAQIRATAQGSGTVTFACETVPTEAVMVNVLILG